MLKKTVLSFILLLSASLFVRAQIRYTSIPMDSQLVARNLNTNMGTFNVKGTVGRKHTRYGAICLKIYRDSTLTDSMYQPLTYVDNIAPFDFSFQIPAELHEYKISVYGIKNRTQTLDTAIRALLAGDVYIIEGQSNSFAQGRDGENADTNKSEFIRAFGNSDSSTRGLLANLRWFRGEGNGDLPENGHIGQWGLRLGRLLIDSIKIPVAIFNGAFGGRPISYFKRPSNYKTTTNSNYGRLYYRLTMAGLRNNVRAIMWSQGESDGAYGTSMAAYIQAFDTLQKDWKQDFPGFRKTYIFQTKTENIEPLYNIMQIEEAQREIALASDSDIEIMSTAALKPDKGGLHFDYTGGYEEFGNRIYRLIARDIYKFHTAAEIDAPMIENAYLCDSTTLIIVENARSLQQHDTSFPIQSKPINSYQLENAKPGITINSIAPHKNEIVLKLSKYPGNNITVSYLAPIHNTGTNWLTNTNGIEMICFYQYPVKDSVSIFAGIENYKKTLPIAEAYPNPCYNYTTIILPTNAKYTLELDDLTGQKLQSFNFKGKSYKLLSQSLPKGAYSVRVFDKKNNVIYSAKLRLE